MKTEYKFSIENIILDEIINKPNILLQKIDPSLKLDFENYLLDNQTNKDGSPSISNLTITSLSYNPDKNEGKFRLSFNIDRIYCCSDIEASNSDYVDFTFYFHNDKLLAKTEYFVWELNN